MRENSNIVKLLKTVTPRFTLACLVIISLLRLFWSAYLPLSPDETYYTVWSYVLAGGYLDHPPMVAIWVAAGRHIAGLSSLGVRLMGPIAGFLASLLLWQTTRDILTQEKGKGITERCSVTVVSIPVLLLNVTPGFNVQTVTMTPDTPLITLTCLMLFCLCRAVLYRSCFWWALTGGVVGLILDSKYTIFLPIIGLILWLFLTQTGRSYLNQPGPWIAGIMSGFVFLPVLLWNSEHNWVSFLKQAGRASSWNMDQPGRYLGEFLLGQMGLASPIISGLFFIVLWEAFKRRIRSPLFQLLSFITIFPIVIFLQHSLGDRVQANWPVFLYPSLCLMVGVVCGRRLTLIKTAIVTAMISTIVIFVQAASGFIPLPLNKDPVIRQLWGWQELAQELQGKKPISVPFIIEDYGLATEMALRIPQRVIWGNQIRWRYTHLPPAAKNLEAILVQKANKTGGGILSRYEILEDLGNINRTANGKVIARYHLFHVRIRQNLLDDKEIVRLPHGRLQDWRFLAKNSSF